jgi:DNA replication and repair protein RecF
VRVQSLHLVNFRNYRDADIVFSPGKNLFLGDNGQGKTNLLEALYFLSHARSHRTTDDRELIRRERRTSGSRISGDWESAGNPDGDPETAPVGFATVTACLDGLAEGETQRLEARIRVEDDRLKTGFQWNGVPLRSRSAVLGRLPTVSFFLPDLLLLRGAPEDRRRWLDAAIVQYDHRHLAWLGEFQKIRQQKNRLLKQPPEAISREHLAVWNAQFAASGARVMASRLAYLSMIEDVTAVFYLELSDGAERLAMAYQTSVRPPDLDRPVFSRPGNGQGEMLPKGGIPDASALEMALACRLEERMPEELRRGTSLVGPHRDDIFFTLDGLAAEAYGSQGQQRGVVLALKLAELQCLAARLQESPVLLLDDVMAELDPTRQRLLLEHLRPDSQVFMTTTHTAGTWRSLLERGTEEMAVFRVNAGRVSNATLPRIQPSAFSSEETPVFSEATGLEGEARR